MTKAYELVKPIGYFPLGIYRLREHRKCYYIECIDDPSHGYNMETEIVENMPEYFVEVKEDWIDELIDRILPHIENSLETAEDYQRIREAIEKNMPKQ